MGDAWCTACDPPRAFEDSEAQPRWTGERRARRHVDEAHPDHDADDVVTTEPPEQSPPSTDGEPPARGGDGGPSTVRRGQGQPSVETTEPAVLTGGSPDESGSGASGRGVIGLGDGGDQMGSEMGEALEDIDHEAAVRPVVNSLCNVIDRRLAPYPNVDPIPDREREDLVSAWTTVAEIYAPHLIREHGEAVPVATAIGVTVSTVGDRVMAAKRYQEEHGDPTRPDSKSAPPEAGGGSVSSGEGQGRGLADMGVETTRPADHDADDRGEAEADMSDLRRAAKQGLV